MYSEQQFSNQKPQTHKTHDSAGSTTAKREDFPVENITFEPTPFDKLLFVTIEYDGSDIQPDPLAADGSVVPNIDSDADHKGYIIIPHRLFRRENVRELPPYLPVVNVDSSCPASQQKNVQSKPTDAQSKATEENGSTNVCQKAQSKCPPASSVPAQSGLDEAICISDDPLDIALEELGKQMVRTIEEKRRTALELKQKRNAEMALAQRLVRKIMKPDSQQVQNPPYSVNPNSAPTSTVKCNYETPKQRRNSVSFLARQLLSKMSKGSSFEQALGEIQAMVPSSNAGTVRDGAIQVTFDGKSAYSGSSFEQIIRELHSTVPPSYAGDVGERASQVTVGGKSASSGCLFEQTLREILSTPPSNAGNQVTLIGKPVSKTPEKVPQEHKPTGTQLTSAKSLDRQSIGGTFGDRANWLTELNQVTMGRKSPSSGCTYEQTIRELQSVAPSSNAGNEMTESGKPVTQTPEVPQERKAMGTRPAKLLDRQLAGDLPYHGPQTPALRPESSRANCIMQPALPSFSTLPSNTGKQVTVIEKPVPKTPEKVPQEHKPMGTQRTPAKLLDRQSIGGTFGDRANQVTVVRKSPSSGCTYEQTIRELQSMAPSSNAGNEMTVSGKPVTKTPEVPQDRKPMGTQRTSAESSDRQSIGGTFGDRANQVTVVRKSPSSGRTYEQTIRELQSMAPPSNAGNQMTVSGKPVTKTPEVPQERKSMGTQPAKLLDRQLTGDLPYHGPQTPALRPESSRANCVMQPALPLFSTLPSNAGKQVTVIEKPVSKTPEKVPQEHKPMGTQLTSDNLFDRQSIGGTFGDTANQVTVGLKSPSSGCTYEQTIRELQSMAPPSNAGNQMTVSGKPVTKTPEVPQERKPMGTQPAKLLDQQLTGDLPYYGPQTPALRPESSRANRIMQPALPSFSTFSRPKMASAHLVEHPSDQPIPGLSPFQQPSPSYSLPNNACPMSYGELCRRASINPYSSHSAVHPCHLLPPRNLPNATIGVEEESLIVSEWLQYSGMDHDAVQPGAPLHPDSTRNFLPQDSRPNGVEPGNVYRRTVDLIKLQASPVHNQCKETYEVSAYIDLTDLDSA